MKSLLVLSLVIWSSCLVSALADDWPQQGGPNRDGIVPANGLSPDIKDTDGKLPVLWQTSVGYGAAPVVVKDGFVYTYGVVKHGTPIDSVTKASAVPAQAEIDFREKDKPADVDWSKAPEDILPTKATEEGPNHGTAMGTAIDWNYFKGDLYAYCFEAATGKLVWATLLTEWGLLHGNHNLYPIGSPLVTKGKLYIHTQTGQLYALSTKDGQILWHESMFNHKMSLFFNKQCNAVAPLLVGNNLIIGYITFLKDGMDSQSFTLAAFNSETGKEIWMQPCPSKRGFRSNNTTIGFATINDDPTVLVSGGQGTVGVDPATGKTRWFFDIYEANPDTMKNTPEEYAKDKGIYEGNLSYPYPSYAPVCWKNYVMDATNTGHDTVTSKTWCIQIVDNKPSLVWETNVGVPMSECEKGNMLAAKGRLYLLDASGTDPSRVDKDSPVDPKKGWNWPSSRLIHGGQKDVGSFQCYDIPTGKLLWSTNDLGGFAAYHRSNMILAGDALVLCREGGVWIAKVSNQGVIVQAHLKSGWFEMAEPVLCDGKLYIRQKSTRNYPQALEGLSQLLGENTLFCIDVSAAKP